MAYTRSASLLQPHVGAVSAPPPPRCINHRSAEADWRCAGCGQTYCSDCMESRTVDPSAIVQCPSCGNEPISLAPPAIRPSFYQKLLSAPVYPLRGWGRCSSSSARS